MIKHEVAAALWMADARALVDFAKKADGATMSDECLRAILADFGAFYEALLKESK